ncbi:MAG: type II toxin-antitoxin system HipA family toxin [Azospirillum sp.]|nr:type II toxin-antitoxin system HipA family toxin [Azospirillum sp.]
MARLDARGSTFVYDPMAQVRDAVSMTMPLRPQSWNSEYGMLPIFEMNMPEGSLKERLRNRFSKALGKFDDLDMLSVVGRSQIGRLRYSGLEEELSSSVPFQSVDEILKSRRSGELYEYLLDRFIEHSGVSGVQPKLLIRDEDAAVSLKHNEVRQASVRGATHIVKFWGEDFKELAANEFFCLEVARRLELNTPPARLSEDGSSIVIERFDLKPDGTYLGFEDFCVLNGHGAEEKYLGSYETKLFKRLSDYMAPARKLQSSIDLFRMLVLNCALRNGDAHLKNFGIVYEHPSSEAALAPVYDVVTTPVYMPKDAMALTLFGTTNWPDPVRLTAIGKIRAGLDARKIGEIFEATADAMRDVGKEMTTYFGSCKHPEVGDGIAAAWEDGIAESLGLSRNPGVVFDFRMRP